MAARAAVDIITQLGIEKTPGTAVAATKLLSSLMVDFSPRLDTRFSRASGQRYTTTGVKNKGWAEGSFEGVASYNELAVLLSGLFGPASISNPASGAYLWDFDPQPSSADPLVNFTARRGDSTAALVAAYLQFASLQLRASRDETQVSGSLFAKEPDNAGALTSLTDSVQQVTITGSPTGGTFTLTWSSQTTSGIAYNASAATVKTALEALSNIDPGDIEVYGGPLPSAPIQVRFIGPKAAAAQTAITGNAGSLTGGSSPTISIAQLVTGGAALSGYTEKPISGNELCVYLDSSSGGLGGTLLTDVLSVEWSLPEAYKPKWVANCNVSSFKESTPVAREDTSLVIRAEYNSQMRALYDALNVNALTPYFCRVEHQGALITGSTYHKSRLDSAVKLASLQELKDEDGVYGFEFGFRVFKDATWGRAFRWQLTNTLPSLF
jgi:hypothetical protein